MSDAIARDEYRPPYVAAAIAATLVLVLYVGTLGPSTAMWDTSEYIAAAYILGMPHPPGNPFFVLLGRVWSMLPVAPEVAARINLLSATCSAVSAGLWFLVTERVVRDWLSQRALRLIVASLAALIGATAFTVWAQSVVNEKVYTVSLVGLALIAWLMLRWLDSPDGPRADRTLVLVAYLLGLGYANHMAGMLAAPAVGLAVLMRRPATLRRWRLLLACAGAMLLGVTPFVMQPIRAAHHPALNTGEVTGCRDRIAVDCTLSRTTLERFQYNAGRGQYGKPSLLERQAPFTAQVGMWWLYFKWQWLRDPAGTRQGAQLVFAWIMLCLAALGAVRHWRTDRRSFAFMATLVFTTTILLVWYMNFRLGWTQALQLGVDPTLETTEVRDRDYFFLWGFSLLSVWIAVGLSTMWATLASWASRGRGEPAPRAAWLATVPILALAFVPLVANWNAASRRGDTFTRDWAHDLLNTVEPYGILITQGDNDTFPLWYAQEVEGIRRDVTVAVASYLRSDWYIRSLLRRPVVPYDTAAGPALFRARTWPEPTRPLLALTTEELDSIPEAMMLEQPQRFVHGEIDTVVPAGLLLRDQVLVLRFIRDAFPERALYFTSGGYERSLGLAKWVTVEGVARRLRATVPVASPEMMEFGDSWFDVTRTRALWDDVYRGPQALFRLGQWVDRPSQSIPWQYAYAGSLLAEALAARGDSAQAKAVADTVQRIVRVAGLGE